MLSCSAIRGDTLTVVPGTVRCAVYTRVSVARPNDDLSSCVVQRDTGLAYVAAHAGLGWVALDERFDDEGYSGATMDRPAFFRLLERVDARAVDRILVTRMDRLTRRLSDWVWLIAQLRKRNVAVSIVTGQMANTEIAADSFVFNIMASFAEFEREIISDRVRDAHAAHRLRGLRSAGRVPFGYRADPETHQLVVHEPEASVVRQMFAMAQEGEPPTIIAAATNSSDSKC